MKSIIKKILSNLFLVDIIYTIIFVIANIFINFIGLMMRQWLFYTNCYIIFIIGIIGLYQLFLKIKIDALKFVICFLYTFALIFLVPAILFISVLSYYPEHIVEKDGIKMVAYVKSFLSVNVNYYEYKNVFFVGNKILINEYYGEGGYDPLDSDHSNRIPEHITYYTKKDQH